VNVVGAVMDEFLYAVEHPEAGEPNVKRLVDTVITDIAPRPGWTQRQLRRATTPRRRNLAPRLERGGADQK